MKLPKEAVFFRGAFASSTAAAAVPEVPCLLISAGAIDADSVVLLEKAMESLLVWRGPAEDTTAASTKSRRVKTRNTDLTNTQGAMLKFMSDVLRSGRI